MDTGNMSGGVSDHRHAGLSGAATALYVSHTGQWARKKHATPGLLSEPEQHPAPPALLPHDHALPHAMQQLPAGCAAGHRTMRWWPCQRPPLLLHFALL